MPSKSYNVFLSWSGKRSGAAADAFREWLPTVLQSAKPWKSDFNIEKGTRSATEIDRALEGMKVGIAFLTPENLESTWIHYESGALAKTIDDKTRLCTYLLDDLKSRDIKPPLGRFQHTEWDKEETRKLVTTINGAINEEPLKDEVLNKVFDKMWPDLEAKLASLPAAVVKKPVARSVEDILGEILDLVRGLAKPTNPSAWGTTPAEDYARYLNSLADPAAGASKFFYLSDLLGTKPEEPKRTYRVRLSSGEIKNFEGDSIAMGEIDGLKIYSDGIVLAEFQPGEVKEIKELFRKQSARSSERASRKL